MGEYIEREAFLKWAREFFPNDKVFASAIINAPAADVSPVVRCKECKYSYADLDGLCCAYGVCVDSNVPEDFYCANGERQGGAEC